MMTMVAYSQVQCNSVVKYTNTCVPSGGIYNENEIRPSLNFTQFTDQCEETWSPNTNKDFLNMSNKNRSTSELPQIHQPCAAASVKILWSTVSKAAPKDGTFTSIGRFLKDNLSLFN